MGFAWSVSKCVSLYYLLDDFKPQFFLIVLKWYIYILILQDEQIHLTDIENSVPGLTQYIAAPKNHSLFLPEELLEKLEVSDTEESIASVAATKYIVSKEELLKQQKLVLKELEIAKEREEYQKLVDAVEKVGENVDEQLVELRKLEQSQAERLRQHERMQFDDDHQESRSFEHYHGSCNSASDFPKSQSTNPSQFRGGPDILASSGEKYSNNFDIGSMIQIRLSYENNPWRYGVIRWIGMMPKVAGTVAGIELVSLFCLFVVVVVV